MSNLILDSIFFYYPGLEVLRGAYLEVQKGEVTCLIGRNGSGKSTLFKIAAGQLQADSGLTIISENRIHQPSKKERFKHLAYLPQKSFLPRSLSVKDLISEEAVKTDELLQRISTSKIKELSTGERRYVEFKFILQLNREFILLDEPFTGLAPVMIEKMVHEIYYAKDTGTGILISDHYMRYIVDVGDTFYLLENGQVKTIDSGKNSIIQ
ncbi:MAG: ABC transporter ATP-binding protein [Balneola sp.]|mgnify:CR=1 FL=1|nr:ABC transporter ATP-binding protein [Balneola sp.]|tara:strand:+ start:133290 stop:133919 length:630 start_codon:yes stop_codon:yes gene_type:complete